MRATDSESQSGDQGALRRFFSLGFRNPLVRYGTWLLFILLIVRLAYLGFPGLPVPRAGDKATLHYVAPRTVSCELPNPSLDDQLRRVRDSVPQHYIVDNAGTEERQAEIRSARHKLMEALRTREQLEKSVTGDPGASSPRELLQESQHYRGQQGGGGPHDQPAQQAPESSESRSRLIGVEDYIQSILQALAPSVPDEQRRRVLKEISAQPHLIEIALDASDMALEEVKRWFIVDRYSWFDQDRNKGIVVLDNGAYRSLTGEDQVFAWESALEAIQQQFTGRIIMDNYPLLRGNSTVLGYAEKLVKSSVRPNFLFDELATEQAVAEAEERVSRTTRKEFSQGQVIITLGEGVEEWQSNCIKRLSTHRSGLVSRVLVAGIPLPTLLLLLGTLALTLGLAVVLKRFTRLAGPNAGLSSRDFLAVGVLVVLHLSLVRLTIFLASVVSVNYPELGRSVMLTAAPVALVPMILGTILGPTVALLGTLYLTVITIVIALMSGPEVLSVGFPVYYGFYLLSASLIGIWVTRRVTRRGTYLLGGMASAAGGVFAWAVALMLEGGQVAPEQVVRLFVAVLVSGAVTYILLISLVPIFEYVWDYTTDSRLLELGSTDHAALRELARLAPGTYQHSMWIAVLVEEAAEAIGANSLLARVGAYYHDLGKLAVSRTAEGGAEEGDSSAYFAENQGAGANPHDHMPPRMSAQLIKRHVARSVTMIRKFRLGRRVMDIAAEHHGTTLLEHFYHKALAAAREGGYVVDEQEYRYPGPKPQSKEAALVMLADSVEASVRALSEHEEDTIRRRVDEIIRRRIEDDQLDDSTLTFGDVRRVEQSFVKTLMSMYHIRPEYNRVSVGDNTVRFKREDVDGELGVGDNEDTNKEQ